MQGLITLAEQQTQNQSAGLISQLLMFALIIVVFYLLFIRPQQKRRQQELEMQKSLQPGMQVLTGAGIYGTVVEVHEDDIELEISPGTRIRMVKAAVARIVSS